jgi:hypothetical protein
VTTDQNIGLKRMEPAKQVLLDSKSRITIKTNNN